MKRENIEIGIKVVPHSKSYCGDLENSVNWNYAKMINQPYLFVSRIHNDYIVLDTIKGSNNGDFFLPEDFEPYIEETKTNLENNNEGRNIKMEKFDLNSSMLFKMRDEKLYALLPDHENDLVFYDVEDINAGYTEGTVFFNDTCNDLEHCDDSNYDIIAIKQYKSYVEVLSQVLCNREPKEWDWVKEIEKEDLEEESKVENTVQNITINITIDSKMDINNLMCQIENGIRNLNFNRLAI